MLKGFPGLRVVGSAAVVAGALAGSISLTAQGGPPQPVFVQGGQIAIGRGVALPGGAEAELVAQFDKDADKRLNAAERKEARTWLAAQGGGRGRGINFAGR